MAPRPWPCRRCGFQLGDTIAGHLHVSQTAGPVTLDPAGIGWVACPSCGARRSWRPTWYTTRDRDATSAARLVGGT